jgi:hypothetical protein
MNRQVWGLSLLFGAFALIQAIGEPTSGLAYQQACSLLKAWGSLLAALAATSLPAAMASKSNSAELVGG